MKINIKSAVIIAMIVIVIVMTVNSRDDGLFARLY